MVRAEVLRYCLLCTARRSSNPANQHLQIDALLALQYQALSIEHQWLIIAHNFDDARRLF